MVKIELDHRLVTTRILQRSYTDTTLFNFKIQLVEIEKRIAVHKYYSRKGLVAIAHFWAPTGARRDNVCRDHFLLCPEITTRVQLIFKKSLIPNGH